MPIKSIIDELVTRHRCHTVILYGSRARDEHTDASDYDLLGIREGAGRDRDAREFQGAYLDAFIYGEDELKGELEPDLIRLRHGKALIEKDVQGQALIARAQALFDAGPKRLSRSEAEALRHWVRKMFVRISRGGPEDIEANFRRVWLLHDLLEIYFKLRGQWYLGPKESFAWLERNDLATHDLFELALSPDASRGSLRILAEHVIR